MTVDYLFMHNVVSCIDANERRRSEGTENEGKMPIRPL